MRKARITTRSMMERMFYINKLIKAGKCPNTPELSEALEVSVATISRDIEFLRDRLRAPIVYDPARRGYIYTEPFDLTKNIA